MPCDHPASIADYDYELPETLLARHPPAHREDARLLVIRNGKLQDRGMVELPELLQPGDLLVANDSRVMHARCFFHRHSGGRVELLFLEPGPGPVEALVRPSRRLVVGEILSGADGAQAELMESLGEGLWRVRTLPEPLEIMAAQGHVPLPPYIRREDQPSDRERYQTVFAREPGSSAAPTAGLHLTDALLGRLRDRGVDFQTLTLHVGTGTFRKLAEEDLQRGELHKEFYYVPETTAARFAETRARGGRVIAVGTTSVRTLESAFDKEKSCLRVGAGSTRLFIREGYSFQAVDGLLTNFHLPCSSLLMLVGAWLGLEPLKRAYRHAIDQGYRFYSYGDAMLVL